MALLQEQEFFRRSVHKHRQNCFTTHGVSADQRTSLTTPFPNLSTLICTFSRGNHYTKYAQPCHNLQTFLDIKTAKECAPHVLAKTYSNAENQVCTDEPSSVRSSLSSNDVKQIRLHLCHGSESAIVNIFDLQDAGHRLLNRF